MLNIERNGNIEIVSFTVDRINALITEEIREKTAVLFENQQSKVVIDLKGVEYIDSSGFGYLLSILRDARNNYGTLKISGPEPSVLKLFETLHLHTVFEIYSDLGDCLRAFK
jgi:anti-sigma B factor antagonist